MSVPVLQSSVKNPIISLDKKLLPQPFDVAKKVKDTLKESAKVSNSVSYDNYPVGKIDNQTQATPSHKPPVSNGLSDIILNGLALNDLQYGIKQIVNPEKNVLSAVAQSINTDTPTLANKVAHYGALQTAYDNATFSMGVGFVCSGLGGLLRLGTNISDIYHNRNKTDNTPKESNKTHARINQMADILSSVGNLITVKNMIHALRTPNVIPQALSAFGSGATASATTVATIQAGVGLLAAGVTISSVKTLFDIAKNIMKNDTGDTQKQDEKTIQSSLMSATEQLTKGIGNVILLKNPFGFQMASLLNWDNNLVFIKPLEWFNAGASIIGGTVALKDAAAMMRRK